MPHWTTWPRSAQLRLLAEARYRLWLTEARPEQIPPEGDWQTWYLRGGRGAGKTRTGAETLAAWCFRYEPGDWMVMAPTFADAKRCVEMPKSGLLAVLGGYPGPLVRDWNRSEGAVYLANGAVIHLDGANDGADRTQGYNLCGAWCDEIGLWERWQHAWNESLRPAVREDPSKIIATGTPKMGHGLVAKLLGDPNIPCSAMRTSDNFENLNQAMQELAREYAGTTLGRQELDGEFIAALEGEVLPRHAWEFFRADLPVTATDLLRNHDLRRFDQIVHSWDTTWKAKATSDFVSGQAWGIKGPHRYLLRLFHERASLEATVEAMLAMLAGTRALWPRVPHRILVENTAFGPEAAAELSRRVDGVFRIRAMGDKLQRALAASPALESGHCHLPGVKDPDPAGQGYSPEGTPPRVQTFVEECSMFSADMKHEHDDQVDSWSQMVNWTRGRASSVASAGKPHNRIQPGSLAGFR